MTNPTFHTDYLSSIAAQIAASSDPAEITDLYLLARGAYYKVSDAGQSDDEHRAAWRSVMAATDATPTAPVVGLVTFSDGSRFGR